MYRAGLMCTALSWHVFHISAPLSDTATTSQVLIKPAPPLLPGRTTGLSLPLHARDVLEDQRTQQLPFQICVFPVPTQKQNTKRISTSQAQYLSPLFTSPLSLDLHFPWIFLHPRWLVEMQINCSRKMDWNCSKYPLCNLKVSPFWDYLVLTHLLSYIYIFYQQETQANFTA